MRSRHYPSGFEINLGDRVESLINENECNSYINIGTTGTVVHFAKDTKVCIGVQWDVTPSYPFHNCNGHSLPQCGYYVRPASIDLVNDRDFDPESFESLFDSEVCV